MFQGHILDNMIGISGRGGFIGRVVDVGELETQGFTELFEIHSCDDFWQVQNFVNPPENPTEERRLHFVQKMNSALYNNK